MRLHQVSYSFKAHKETGPGRRGQPDRRHRRLRAVDLPRDRVAGRGRAAAPRHPAVGHQRARAAVAALRRRRGDGADLPRAAAAARARAGDRRHVVRRHGVLRRHRRPRPGAGRRHVRRLPRPRPSTSCSTPSATAGRRCRAGAASRRSRAASRDASLPARHAAPARRARPGREPACRRRRGRRARTTPRTSRVRRADDGRGDSAVLAAELDPANGAAWSSSPRCPPSTTSVTPGRRRRRPRRRRRRPGRAPIRTTSSDLGWYATQEIPDLLPATGIERRGSPSDNIAGMDAVTHPPHPVNEPNLTYAPGSRRARGAAAGAASGSSAARSACARTSAAGGATAAVPRSRSSSRTTTSTCSAPSRRATQRDTEAAIKAAQATPLRAGGRCRSTTAPRSSSRPPTCWPAPGASA